MDDGYGQYWVMGLGPWRARWAAGRLRDEEPDPSLLMWDMRRFVRLQELPQQPVVVHFHCPTHAPVSSGGGWCSKAARPTSACKLPDVT